MKEYSYLFSVIMPVYNAEEYLSEAFDSIVNQSIGFENIQLILVNDGSTDKSGEICRELQKKYSGNVIYIEKENGGVSSARNAGIPFIKGRYVNFLDSDDKWDINAFKAVYDFFEEHYDEADVVSCRVKKFEASDNWHILDFKFSKGSRVVDLSDEKKASLVQSHACTAIIKAEAITEADRFAENVKFGEDSMFINGIILRSLKLGIVPEAVYYYRKRKNQSSATQTQTASADYYSASPRAYYGFLTEKSRELYNEVVPYIQNVLLYDIGWRVREAPSEAVLSSKELYENYCELMKSYLNLIDEKYIVSNRVHKRIGYKTALIRLRDGTDLFADTSFNRDDKAVFYKDMRLLRLQGSHKLCYINKCKIRVNPETKKSVLILEGLIAKWVFDCCKDEEVDFVIRVGKKKKYKAVRKDYELIKDENFFGENNRYDFFRKKIVLDDYLAKKDKVRAELCLSFSGKSYAITVNYGEGVNTDKEGKLYNNLAVICKSSGVIIRKKEVEA